MTRLVKAMVLMPDLPYFHGSCPHDSSVHVLIRLTAHYCRSTNIRKSGGWQHVGEC